MTTTRSAPASSTTCDPPRPLAGRPLLPAHGGSGRRTTRRKRRMDPGKETTTMSTATDPRTDETLAAFTARHEALGHYVWSEEDLAYAYESEEDSDRDRDSSGDLSDKLVIEVWDAAGAKR